MIRSIIIDDEPLARSLLRGYVNDYDDIEVVGEYGNGFDGIKGITELKPDLVFLDIQMPKLNGFEMLELLDEIPQIIFVTAYDRYALKAFENNAADYLLKPFSRDRLDDALRKAKRLLQAPANNISVKDLLAEHQSKIESIDRIAVKTGTKIKIIYIDDIQYLESQDDYVMIYTGDGKYLKQKTMKFFEANLPEQEFIRVHRSYIVRTDFVEQIELYEKDSYLIKLKNEQTVPVSKSGYNRLRETLNF
ncbi:MAG: LytTR family transcriptional regulator DNA-binding domain-containing protein [Cytophagales bacterium]|nr:LytTR family transcriptional regulator DNA-binding domain-containing protein [Cytophagales bacterium]